MRKKRLDIRRLHRTCILCSNPIADRNKSGCCTACWNSEDEDVREKVYAMYPPPNVRNMRAVLFAHKADGSRTVVTWKLIDNDEFWDNVTGLVEVVI